MLFKTPIEVREFVRVDFPSGKETALPGMQKAENRFIVPILGEELYGDLVSRYTNADIDDVYKPLLRAVQAAVAPLAYWLDLPFINTRITENGLRKLATDTQQPVFKWDYEKIREALEDSGMEALENLICFLETHMDQFPQWETSDAYRSYTRFFIRSGAAFSAVYPLVNPRLCFLSLASIMSMVEDMYINKTIGPAFADYLKGIRAPSNEEVTAIGLIKKAAANLTIYHAAARMSVRLTKDGFSIPLSDSSVGQNNQSADTGVLERLRSEVQHIGHSYLKQVSAYLNQHAGSTVFTIYYESEFYEAPGQQAVDINASLRSTFFM